MSWYAGALLCLCRLCNLTVIIGCEESDEKLAFLQLCNLFQ